MSWDAIVPSELLVLQVELARVDAIHDDSLFFAPFAAYFDARIGRPSIPMGRYLRLLFLKFRYRLGYEVLCRECAAWRFHAHANAASHLTGSNTGAPFVTRSNGESAPKDGSIT
jgi:IS5 family transposase